MEDGKGRWKVDGRLSAGPSWVWPAGGARRSLFGAGLRTPLRGSSLPRGRKNQGRTWRGQPHALDGAGPEKMTPGARLRTGQDDEFGPAGTGFGQDLLVSPAQADADLGGVRVAEKKKGELAQRGQGLGADFLVKAAVGRGDVEFHHVKQGGGERSLRRGLLQVEQGVRRAAAQIQWNQNAFAVHNDAPRSSRARPGPASLGPSRPGPR